MSSLKPLFVCGIATAFLTAICGCRSIDSVQGFPHDGLDTRKNIKDRYKRFNAEDYEKHFYAQTDQAKRKEARDGYIHDRKALIDTEYAIFVKRLSGVKNWKDVSKTIAVGTMGVVGGIVGGGTAQTLSAASAATTLTDAAVDTVFFYNATLPAIKAAMDASRATTFVRIAEGLTNSASAYDFLMAQNDLDSYRDAGTVLGASNQIQKDAKASGEIAKKAATAVKENADPATTQAKSAENVKTIELFNSR